ncbi:MAG TPA: DUF262 domain-containing protein [Thermoanaerobaculia bacterium]|nr:DUF262 domain-containing protein [Thermoanaerobaculia bacterium]
MKYSATATNRKISWFAREDGVGALDLTPEFQRRHVWQEDQSSYLIDTILNGLPFPEIYVRSDTTDAGDTTYQIVDGQQRIRSILDFAKNDLVLVGEDVSPRLVGKSFEDLSPDEKKTFWNYDVVVRDLVDATDGDIRDVFRRLNVSAEILTDQELRHAEYTGKFRKLMEELADDEWWLDHRVVNVRQVRRMEDVEFVSELFVAMMAGPQNKKLTLDQYYEDYDKEFPDEAKSRVQFTDTRALIESILSSKDIKAWSGKSDFYTLFTVLTAYSDQHWTKTQRQRVRDSLMRFRGQVDQAKKKDNTKTFPKRVHEYAEAVTRAATDAARRTTRQDIVDAIVRSAIKAAA